MTPNGSYASEDSSSTTPTPTASEATAEEGVGFRAADLLADRYVELEHERRTLHFARAVTLAQES